MEGKRQNWDLGILRIAHDKVVLTTKGAPGYVGTNRVFEFSSREEIEDFIAQLNAVADFKWSLVCAPRGEKQNDNANEER